MKKITIIIMAALLPTMTFAQLKVDASGRTMIGTTTNNNSSLKIQQGTNDSFALSAIGTGTKCVSISNNCTAIQSTFCEGLKVNHTAKTTSNNIGIESWTTNNSSGSTFGIRSYASNNSTGISLGVSGFKNSSNSGAGVFGSSVLNDGSSITGSYAGYFFGNVKVTGTIDGTLVNSSDARLKENIQSLDEDAGRGGNTLSSIDLLTPISFNYKDTTSNSSNKNGILLEDPETGELVESEIEEVPNPVMLKKHFGFVAQELQKVYPDLVYEQDNGYLAVNYTELIPVLVQAIKELKNELDEMKGNTSARKIKATETTDIDSSSIPTGEGGGRGFLLSQNVPNPFTEKTDIAIYLPETVQTATLYIYDLSGKQLEQHPVTGRGNTVMTIHADKMDAGMYVYSLVADKKIVTTKKMMVVK